MTIISYIITYSIIDLILNTAYVHGTIVSKYEIQRSECAVNSKKNCIKITGIENI